LLAGSFLTFYSATSCNLHKTIQRYIIGKIGVFILKIGFSLKIHEKPVSVFQRQLAFRYCINSGSWHVAINYYVKPTVHGVGMYSVGIHDMTVYDVGVHDVDVCSVDVHCVGMHAVDMQKHVIFSAVKN
jgi:hypothetical protein